MNDHADISKRQAMLDAASRELYDMHADVADARTVKEFTSDQMKRAFSVLVAEQLSEGKSVSAAEHYARASAAFGQQLQDFQLRYKEALRIIERQDAVKTRFESHRSNLSMERAVLGNI